MIRHVNSNEMKVTLVTLTSNKMHSKARDAKKSVHQENITNLNVHVLNNIALIYIRQKHKT